ncbi:MAG: hypothetical protein ACREQW_19635 [Candidatus Binatia bacterium]
MEAENKLTQRFQESTSSGALVKITAFAALALLAVGMIANFKDIVRYIRISTM